MQEHEPRQQQPEIIKPVKHEIALQLCKSAEILLAEYAIKGGTDMEYVEYLRGNRPDPRD